MAAKKKKKVNKKSIRVETGAAKPKPAPSTQKREPVATKSSPALAGVRGSTEQINSEIKTLLHKINTSIGGKGGSRIIAKADEVSSNSYLRRPSGILQLDVDCGGGIPAQELITIGGPSNAGKSTLVYHYFAQHQRIYGRNSLIAATHSEGNIDYVQARRCGWIVPFPDSAIEALQASRKEQGFPPLTREEIAELRREVGTNVIVEASTMEEVLDANLDLLGSNKFGLISIDSYEGLLPGSEAALDSLEDETRQAQRAALITRFCQKYNAIKRNPRHFTTLIITTQVRSNRKKSEMSPFMAKFAKDYSDDKVAYALQHARALHIGVDSGAKIDDGNKTNKVVKGKQFTWRTVKGKAGTHDNIHGETPYYYDSRCFDIANTVVLTALRYGVIREEGGLFTFYRNGQPDDYLCRLPNKEVIIEAMLEDPTSEWSVRWEVCRVAGVSPIYH